jgi:mRNA-degrading endonuclease YafQ of YafQ-DinJ toxin-antitoxin module
MKQMTTQKSLMLIVLANLLANTSVYALDKDPQLDAQLTRYWTAQTKRDWSATYDLLDAQDKALLSRTQYSEFRNNTGVFDPINPKTADLEIADNLAWVLTDFDAKIWRFADAPTRHSQLWQLWQKTDTWHPASEAERQKHPALPPKLRLPSEESTLAERAKNAWLAKSSQDWKSFYTNFLPPDYRASVSAEEFLKKKAQYLYSSTRVDWAQVVKAKPDEATVKITFGIKPNDPLAAKLDAQERGVIESWIKQKGEWYFNIPMAPEAGKINAIPKNIKYDGIKK